MAAQSVPIRLICVDPPAASDSFETVEFGLQDKKRALMFGVPTPDGGLRFDFELAVKQHVDGTPNFSGNFAHGSRQERFVYLTLMALRADDWQIIRRIKVQLGTITWAQVTAVLGDAQQVLQVTVSGQGAATVPLLDGGWQVQRRG